MYLTVLVILIIGVLIFQKVNNKLARNSYFLFSLLCLTVLSGMRYRVGGDSLAYEDYYIYYPDLRYFIDYISEDNSLGYQPLWIFCVSFVKTYFSGYYVWQFFHAFALNLTLFFFLKKYTKYEFSFLFLFYISLLYFYYSFEIQRETLAVCIFLLNLENLKRKKWIRYYCLCSLSFLFHFSALLTFFIPLLSLFKIKKSYLIIGGVFGGLLFFLKEPIFNFLSFLFFTDEIKQKSVIYAQKEFSLLGFISYYFVRVILALPYIIHRYKNQADKWLYTCFLIVSIFSLVFPTTERFLNYLYIILIVDFVNYIHSIEYRMLRLSLKSIVRLNFVLILIFVIPYKLLISDNYKHIFFPYESIITSRVNIKRENAFFSQWD